MEELSIVGKCNGVFSELYRPDLNEENTQKEILDKINNFKNKKENKKEKEKENNPLELNNENYEDSRKIFSHNPNENHDCKNENLIKIKFANFDFFKVCVFSTTRRNKFILVTNTNRKKLKQSGDGHFSIVSALHENTNNILMMETARFKYNSMWFNLNDVYDSFFELDSSTNKTRGFLLCSKFF
jgi:hypothetical protein